MPRITNVFSFVLISCLASCGSVPPVPSKPTDPIRLPPLPAPCAQERDWLGRMESFLQGKLPPLLPNSKTCATQEQNTTSAGAP